MAFLILLLFLPDRIILSPWEVFVFLSTCKKALPFSKKFMYITEKKDFTFKYVLNV